MNPIALRRHHLQHAPRLRRLDDGTVVFLNHNCTMDAADPSTVEALLRLGWLVESVLGFFRTLAGLGALRGLRVRGGPGAQWREARPAETPGQMCPWDDRPLPLEVVLR